MNIIYTYSLLIIVTIQLVHSADITCPTGWLSNGQMCYYDAKKSYDTDTEAIAACLAIDPKATLPTTHNDQELTSLLNAFKNYTTKLDVYIGLKFNKTSKEWHWGDGPVKSYHPWSPDADYTGESGHCVDLELGNKAKVGWNTNKCKESKNLVCQQIVHNIIDVYTVLTEVLKDLKQLQSDCKIDHVPTPPPTPSTKPPTQSTEPPTPSTKPPTPPTPSFLFN